MTSDSLAPARLQAAAAARIKGQLFCPSIHDAASSDNAGLVRDHIVADPAALHAKTSGYVVAFCYLLKTTRWILFQKFHLISICTPSGGTALLISSINGHREVCELLISSGAQVNAKNNRYVALPLFIF
jgi:hypothetical protein